MPAAAASGLRSEKRHHRRGAGSQKGSVSQTSPNASFLDAPAPLSPSHAPEQKITTDAEEVDQSSQHGISILKEIFPELTEAEKIGKVSAKPTQPPLQQLLGKLPSPARAPTGSGSGTQQWSSMPVGPPAHAPMLLAAPVVPPPPTLPAPACQAQQVEHCAHPRNFAPTLPEQSFPSYRERLRAGGRGAFQRAYDAGFMPKNMKQEWSSSQTAQGMLPQQQDMQNSEATPYGNAQQAWSAMGQMQSDDYCGVPMQSQYPCIQQAQQPQMQMMLPPMAMQHQPMLPMAQSDISPMTQMQMPQMQSAHMPTQPLQLPHMAMSQPHTPSASGASTPTSGWPTSGENTPTEMARRECMALLSACHLMPQTQGQFFHDEASLAAQLQASILADCQPYED